MMGRFGMVAVATLSAVIVTALTISGATAARHGARPAAANPCDHYVPTGDPLPRQDTIQQPLVIVDQPGSGHRLGFAKRGDSVQVIKSCGTWVEIHISAGMTGWIAVAALPHELALQNAAKHRDREAAYDCELKHLNNLDAADACKAALAKKQDHP